MKILKSKLNYNLSFFLLWTMMLTIPLSLLFKIDMAGTSFSISYIFLAGFSFVSIVSYLLFVKFNLKFFQKKVVLSILITIFLYFLNSFYSGLDIKYFIFLLTFLTSIVIGYQYSELMQRYFNKQFNLIVYFLTIIGLVLYYFNIPLFDFESTGSELYFTNSYGYYRLSSIILNPNSFAYILLLYFAFFLYSKKSFIGYVMMFLTLVAFLLTESRSALLGLILMLIIYNYQYIKQKIVLFRFSIIGLLFLFIILLVFSSESVLINYDIRFTKFSIALDYIFSSFEYFLLGVPASVSVENNGISFSDNMFLYLIIKMGFLPFLLFTYGYFYSIFKASRILFRENNPNIKPYALFLISSIITMFFSDLLLFSPVYILVGLSIGVLEKGVRFEKSINS